MQKIKYIQLEPYAVLADADLQLMTDQQFGIYWKIIFYLYCNNGKCPLEKLKLLSKTKNFAKVFEKIEHKFQIKNGIVKHKRVSFELRKVRKYLQTKRVAGLKGAKKRWHSHNTSDGSDVANENEVKRSVIEVNDKENKLRIRKDNSASDFEPVVATDSPRQQLNSSMLAAQLKFHRKLELIIPPRNISDRTTFENISRWLLAKITAGECGIEIFNRVIDFANEAARPSSSNPAAVFISILKKRLKYKSEKKV